MHNRFTFKRITLHKICSSTSYTNTLGNVWRREGIKSTKHGFELCIEIFIAFHSLIKLLAKNDVRRLCYRQADLVRRSIEPPTTPDFHCTALPLNVSVIYASNMTTITLRRDTYLTHSRALLLMIKFIIVVYLFKFVSLRQEAMTLRKYLVLQKSAKSIVHLSEIFVCKF